jgi:hypothetical protein
MGLVGSVGIAQAAHWALGACAVLLAWGCDSGSTSAQQAHDAAPGSDSGGSAGSSGGSGGVSGSGGTSGGVDGSAGSGGTASPGWPRPCAGAECGTALAIAAGYDHTCVLLTDGRVACFGRNNSGQLGRVTASNGPIDTTDHEPDVVPGLSGVAEIATGGDVSWALTESGKLYRWGASFNFSDGKDPVLQGSTTPVEITAITGVHGLVAGTGAACGITSAGAVRCWGSNQCGELGVDALVTVADVPGVAGVESLALDEAAVCARHTDGKITCWGAIAEAGDYVCAHEPPTAMDGVPPALSLTTFRDRGCGLDAQGRVTCFGPPPGCGSLDPCLPDAYAPASVPELEAATALLGDSFDLCAAASDTLRCLRHEYDLANSRWQSVTYEQPRLRGARALADGYNRTCALDSEGLVLCWDDVDETPYPLALPH